ncbi:hypothetical protein CEXT_349521 [Caerostris extrusa]|uniref:Uncharacterized protein n=1 Tax=Caerostris extrusa TaxID=172846 RepID=A0AAV4VA77_CAEEX|nr:hypothetical protein CEXT_349521 [Caerostris extrusa]
MNEKRRERFYGSQKRHPVGGVAVPTSISHRRVFVHFRIRNEGWGMQFLPMKGSEEKGFMVLKTTSSLWRRPASIFSSSRLLSISEYEMRIIWDRAQKAFCGELGEKICRDNYPFSSCEYEVRTYYVTLHYTYGDIG